MACTKLLRTILWSTVFIVLSVGCSRSAEDEAFLPEEEEEGLRKNEDLPKSSKIEVIVDPQIEGPVVVPEETPPVAVTPEPIVPPSPILPPLPVPIPVPVVDDFEDDHDHDVECHEDSDCDDDNECTDDECIDGDCENENNTDDCDDGKDCTSDDVCANGECNGTPASATEATDTLCQNGLDDDCDGEIDCGDSQCGGHTCIDNDPCTTADTCSNRECNGTRRTPTDPYTFCATLTPCAYVFCNTTTCATPVLLGGTESCSDNDTCTFPDTCNGVTGACNSGPNSCL